MALPSEQEPEYPQEHGNEDACEQLGVDWSEPHHLISFQYPIVRLIENDTNRVIRFILKVDGDQRQFYEELVEEQTVARVATQLNKPEASFFLLYDFDFRRRTYRDDDTVPRLAPMLPSSNGLSRLLFDVRAYERTVGKTTIRMITSMPADDQNNLDKMMVKVERKSKASAGNGDFTENTRMYEFTLGQLVDGNPEDHPIVPMMKHLIWRESARAIRHVVYWQQESGISEIGVEPHFQPSRRVQAAGVLQALLDPVGRHEFQGGPDASLSPECAICSGPYVFVDDEKLPSSSESHRPVRIRPCGHVFGDACIRTWFSTEVMEDDLPKIPQCPMRCTILGTSTLLRREQDGTYYSLPQFTAYENFEISCADLDGEPPVRRTETQSLVIRKDVMLHALELMTDGALLESSDSTPYNLQTVRYAETQMAIATIANFMKLNNGMRLTYQEIAAYLEMCIAEQLIDKVKGSMSMKFLEPEERQDMTVAVWSSQPKAPVRPGCLHFVTRIIHRMVMFQVKRACDCSLGFHDHGARVFWNPKEFEAEEVDAQELHEEMAALL